MKTFIGFDGKTYSSKSEERRFIQSQLCEWNVILGKCKKTSITVRDGHPLCKPHSEQWDLNKFRVVGRNFK